MIQCSRSFLARAPGRLAAVCFLVAALAPRCLAGAETAGEPRSSAAAVAPPPRATVRNIKIGATDRTYRLYVPEAVAKRGKPAPLVIVLHGATGHSEQVERYMGFNPVADREGLVVAYPQGVGNVWNDDRPQELKRVNKSAQADDVGFLVAVVRDLVKAKTADPGRVYLSGLSNGGFMTARMACEQPGLFAGFAILIASIPKSYTQTCKPQRPLPMLILNGSEDRLAPIEGYIPKGAAGVEARSGTMAVRDHAAFWAARNGCTTSSEHRLNDASPNDGSEIVRTDWAGCAQGGAVTFYLVEGGGHQTPSPRIGLLDQVIGAFLGARNRDAETSELLWDFFKRHQR